MKKILVMTLTIKSHSLRKNNGNINLPNLTKLKTTRKEGTSGVGELGTVLCDTQFQNKVILVNIWRAGVNILTLLNNKQNTRSRR